MSIITPLAVKQARQLAEQSIIQQQRHTVFSLAVSKCKCKAKNSHPYPTYHHKRLTSLHLKQSTFGLASLVSDTIQLGLVVSRDDSDPPQNLSQDPKPGPPQITLDEPPIQSMEGET